MKTVLKKKKWVILDRAYKLVRAEKVFRRRWGAAANLRKLIKLCSWIVTETVTEEDDRQNPHPISINPTHPLYDGLW